MDVIVVASGSGGNCYRIYDGRTYLLLDCGVPIRKIREKLHYRLRDTEACLITHEHSDHAEGAKSLVKAGIDIYASRGTNLAIFGPLRDVTGFNRYRVHNIEPLKCFHKKTWQIIPFPIEHDAAEPFGYLLTSDWSDDVVVYLTDTHYCQYKFNKLTHILIECNYSQEIIEQNTDSGELDQDLAKRIVTSHLSLDNVIRFLQSNDITKLQKIYLLHLSATNSDEEKFRREIGKIVGNAEVIIA